MQIHGDVGEIVSTEVIHIQSLHVHIDAQRSRYADKMNYNEAALWEARMWNNEIKNRILKNCKYT